MPDLIRPRGASHVCPTRRRCRRSPHPPLSGILRNPADSLDMSGNSSVRCPYTARTRSEERVMADARDIHIHLTAQPGTTVHVTIAGDNVTVASDGVEPAARVFDTVTSSDDVLEAAIERLASSGASPNVRAAVEGLFGLGYELKPAKTNVPGKVPENYLRIMDPR